MFSRADLFKWRLWAGDGQYLMALRIRALQEVLEAKK